MDERPHADTASPGDGGRINFTDPSGGFVMVSYSHDDVEFAQRLVAFLRRNAINVWLDDDIQLGQRWDDELRSRIESAAALAVIMTPSSEQSRWVKEEVHYAQHVNTPLLPIRLTGEILFGLHGVQAEDLRSHDLPGQRFLDRVRRLIAETRDIPDSASLPEQPGQSDGKTRLLTGAVTVLPHIVAVVAVVIAALVGVGAALIASGRRCCPPPVPADASIASCLAAQPGRLALVVGAHANAPVPTIPREIGALLTRATYVGRSLSVIRVDGSPTVVQTGITFTSSASNAEVWTRDQAMFLTHLATAVGEVRSVKPESDPLSAIALAARAAGPGGTIAMIDSGLQTLSPLDFRTKGLLSADPDQVATFLESTHQLPDLAGQAVVLAGIGNVVDPQPQLDIASFDNLVDIWKAIIAKAGADCVEIDTTPVTPNQLTNAKPVSIVPIPAGANPPATCGDTVLQDAGSVSFLPDLAEFRAPASAMLTLKTYADRIIAEKLTVELIGTTASFGPTVAQIRLSEARAEAVKDVLIKLGVPASSVTSRGVGVNWPTHVPEFDAQGNLLPGPAAQNRSVVVRLHGPGCSTD